MIDKTVTFRCPQELIENLDSEAKAGSVTRTAVMISRLEVDIPSKNILKRSELPKKAGTYFIWKRGVKKLLDIGKTENINTEIHSHPRLGEFLIEHENTFISWFED